MFPMIKYFYHLLKYILYGCLITNEIIIIINNYKILSLIFSLLKTNLLVYLNKNAKIATFLIDLDRFLKISKRILICPFFL